MTAIQPIRLKSQVTDLASNYKYPEIFIRQLDELLILYGRHVYRAGISGVSSVLLPSYRTPKPVLRQVELELIPLLENDVQSGLVLCDELWKQSYYEFKLLAANIIGNIPKEYAEEAFTRILTWSTQIKDKSLNDALYKKSLVNIISNDLTNIINRVHKWLDSSKPTQQLFGFQILIAALENKSFDNLPLVFNLIAPFIRKAPLTLRPYLIEILINLGERTPKETAYFLLQNLELSIDQDTAWFIRRCLSVFPPDTQASLRKAIRNQETRQ